MREEIQSRHESVPSEGTLYVVATPIGNLGDMTLRALETLRNVHLVAAEDTRLSGNLLKHFGISAKLISVREHNEAAGAEKITAALRAGQNVALVTDAGTPGLSDPGARVVAGVRAAACRVVPIPGASALAAAISISGLDHPHFLFYGFLPPKAGERRTALSALAALPYTLVFYEAPHRILETVADLGDVLGGARQMVLARELTKTFEQIHACLLEDATAWLNADMQRQRGEFVLLVSGAAEIETGLAASREGERVLRILLSAMPASQAVKLAAQISGVKKNTLYELALQLQSDHK